MSAHTGSEVDETAFHADVEYIESLWQRRSIGTIDVPLIDIGKGEPLVFVPILEHLEFVYARQILAFRRSRRVILYRRHETRTHPIGLAERAEEVKRVLDSLGLESADFVVHGGAAMVLFEFATRYPGRCRSLIIIAQGADYQIAPHPFIWFLHELFVRLPAEFLCRTVINYITANDPKAREFAKPTHSLPRHLIEEQFRKIALWPFVYKFSMLPIIHYYDMRERLASLTMLFSLLIDTTMSSLLKRKLAGSLRTFPTVLETMSFLVESVSLCIQKQGLSIS